MIKKRYIAYLAIFVLFVAAIYSFLNYYVNYIFIPQKAAPKIHEYINSDALDPLKVSVERVTFNPFKGFLLHDLIVQSPTDPEGRDLLRAKVVDVDISYLPILWRKIHIKRFWIIDADLNIVRDTDGVWNFSSLGAFEHARGESRFRVVISEVKMPDCRMVYTDNFIKHNLLEREFDDIELKVNRYASIMYRLTLSGGDKDRKKEFISLKLIYNSAKKTARGKAKLHTKYIGDYWDYYLDELLKPWYLKCEELKLHTKFTYSNGRWKLSGDYTVDNASLNYGEISISADIIAGHELTYVKDNYDTTNSKAEVYLKDVSSLLGKHLLLENGKCNLVIRKEEMDIRGLSGTIWGRPLNFNGQFRFGDKRGLDLSGVIADIHHDFHMRLPSYTQGTAEWDFRNNNSYVNIDGKIPDLNDSVFDLDIKGHIDLPDLSRFLRINEDNLSGTIDFSGSINGEADELETIDGDLGVSIKEISVLGLQPTSFDFNMKAKDGVFDGKVPSADFYKGKVYGKARVSFKKWGADIHVDDLDLGEFSGLNPQLAKMTGEFSGDLSFVSRITDFYNTVKSYAYLRVKDCDIRETPLFLSITEGLKEYDENFQMPIFKRAEAIASIAKKTLNISYAFFESDKLNVHCLGKITFDGRYDMTVGTKVLGGGFLKRIMLPHVLGFNMLRDVIELHITGKWPKLKHSAKVEPLAWFHELFGLGRRPREANYNLDKIWTQI